MKWILLGILLGTLLVYPSLLTLTVAAVAWLAAKPVVVAFTLGLLVRSRLHQPRRWTA